MDNAILAERTSNAAATRDGLEGKKLLVVDDSKVFRTAAVRLLNQLGYADILIAEDGAEALRLLQQHKNMIGLVLSDVDMPKLNGIQLLTEIRYDRKGSRSGQPTQHPTDIPVIIATAESSDERKHAAHQMDAAYVTKPYDKDTLVHGMAEAIILAADLRLRKNALATPSATRPEAAPLTFRKTLSPTVADNT